jgi:nitroimidazol reductase NimA-like FMN-containing flavoprotein (pyridoxamine 5'-phosphate oxidase superfamily)
MPDAHPSDPVHPGALVEEGLELLTADECLALAVRRPIGRVAVTVGALPAVFPVNFCMVGHDVVFRTSAGTKLDAALKESVVAFQVDDFDAEGHRGWSVLMVGKATELRPIELARLEPLPVRAWAHGTRGHVVRIRTEFVSGRRIVNGVVSG